MDRVAQTLLGMDENSLAGQIAAVPSRHGEITRLGDASHFQPPFIFRQPARVIAAQKQGEPQIPMGRREIGLERNRLFVSVDGGLQSRLGFLQGCAEIEMCIGEIRLQAQCPSIGVDGFFEFQIVTEFVAQIAPGGGNVRVDRHGRAQGFGRFAGPAQPHAAKRQAEVDEILRRSRILMDSPLEEIDRFGEPPGGLRQQPQKIEGIGISGMGFENPAQMGSASASRPAR